MLKHCVIFLIYLLLYCLCNVNLRDQKHSSFLCFLSAFCFKRLRWSSLTGCYSTQVAREQAATKQMPTVFLEPRGKILLESKFPDETPTHNSHTVWGMLLIAYFTCHQSRRFTKILDFETHFFVQSAKVSIE